MIVVPVFMTNCHVSLKLKSGPVTAQAIITKTARKKVKGFPVMVDASFAKRVKSELLWPDYFISAEYPKAQSLPAKVLYYFQNSVHRSFHIDIIFDERNSFPNFIV